MFSYSFFLSLSSCIAAITFAADDVDNDDDVYVHRSKYDAIKEAPQGERFFVHLKFMNF
jgi:hypothetical protein